MFLITSLNECRLVWLLSYLRAHVMLRCAFICHLFSLVCVHSLTEFLMFLLCCMLLEHFGAILSCLHVFLLFLLFLPAFFFACLITPALPPATLPAHCLQLNCLYKPPIVPSTRASTCNCNSSPAGRRSGFLLALGLALPRSLPNQQRATRLHNM